jgi:hypothetical protein
MRNREVRHVLLAVGGPWIPPLNYSAKEKKKNMQEAHKQQNDKINWKERGIEAKAWAALSRQSRSAQFIST